MESGQIGPRISLGCVSSSLLGLVEEVFLFPLSQVPSLISLPLKPTSRMSGWDRSITGRICQKKATPATMRIK